MFHNKTRARRRIEIRMYRIERTAYACLILLFSPTELLCIRKYVRRMQVCALKNLTQPSFILLKE